jgi:hypothetical protein
LRFWSVALIFLGAGCVPPGYDGDPLRPEANQLPVPDIAPLTPLLASARTLPDAADPDPALRRQAEALQRAAAVAPASERSDLEARGADLRRRAEAVRSASEP